MDPTTKVERTDAALPGIFEKPPSIEDGDYQPGRPLPANKLKALIASKGVAADTLMVKASSMTYADWTRVLKLFISGGDKTAKAIERHIKSTPEIRIDANGVQVELPISPLSKRQILHILKIGIPHLGLPPIEDFVATNPQVAFYAHEELSEVGINRLCRDRNPPGPTVDQPQAPQAPLQQGPQFQPQPQPQIQTQPQQALLPPKRSPRSPQLPRPNVEPQALESTRPIPLATRAMRCLEDQSIGIASRASFLPKMQEIAASESSREHLSIQALMEAGIGLNDLLLGQITAMMRKVEDELEDAFNVRGKISPAKLAMLADAVEKLSKAQTRLVDASQKMRGERGIDTSRQTANAIAILVANLDKGGLQYFSRYRELPAGSLLGQPTSPRIEIGSDDIEDAPPEDTKALMEDRAIDVDFETKRPSPADPADAPDQDTDPAVVIADGESPNLRAKRFAVDIVGDA